jgi:hypothetical protein
VWNHFYSWGTNFPGLVLISSLKLSIVPCEAGPERRGHSRTAFVNISESSCFPRFIVRWILNFIDQPTHENHENWHPTNKSDFTVGEFTTIYAMKQLDIDILTNAVLEWPRRSGPAAQGTIDNFNDEISTSIPFNRL